MAPMTPFSVLDLSPITEGSTAATALRNTLDLARHAEGWGYERYWLAEHHNMPAVASAATSVVIAHVAPPIMACAARFSASIARQYRRTIGIEK